MSQILLQHWLQMNGTPKSFFMHGYALYLAVCICTKTGIHYLYIWGKPSFEVILMYLQAKRCHQKVLSNI